MIKSVIRERQKTSENVKKEIAAQWSSAQTISGPVLNIPVKSSQADIDPEPAISVLHILPESINFTELLRQKKDTEVFTRQSCIPLISVFQGSLSFPDHR